MNITEEEFEEDILEVDHQTQNQMKSAAWWAKVISIPAMGIFGLCIIVLFMVPFITHANTSTSVIGAILIGLYIKIWHFLYKFGRDTEEAIEEENSESLSTALYFLQRYFYYTLLLVGIGIGLLILIILLVGGIAFLK